jgi:hypothetical protein
VFTLSWCEAGTSAGVDTTSSWLSSNNEWHHALVFSLILPGQAASCDPQLACRTNLLLPLTSTKACYAANPTVKAATQPNACVLLIPDASVFAHVFCSPLG